MKAKVSLREIEYIIAQSYNYEMIRQNAVKFYKENLNQNIIDISERCTIFFNPFRHQSFEYDYDNGIEKYFDFELIDNALEQNQAILFKKSFVWALQFLYERKMLELNYSNANYFF